MFKLEGAAASAPSAAGSRCSDLKASLLSQCRQPRTEQPDLSTATAATRRCQQQLERPLRAGRRPTPSRVDRLPRGDASPPGTLQFGAAAGPAPPCAPSRPADGPSDRCQGSMRAPSVPPLYLLGMEEDGTYISSGICVRKLAVKSEIPAFTVPRQRWLESM
jgi:hypothetical protein